MTTPTLGTPVDPNRPDFLKPKYKTVEEQARAYNELEKLMGQRQVIEPPEKYELKLPAGMELTAEMQESFKAAKLSNEQAQIAIDTASKTFMPKLLDMHVNLEQQKFASAIGLDASKAQEEIDRVIAWSKTQKDAASLVQFESSAAGVMYLREKMLAESAKHRVHDSGKPVSSNASAVLTPQQINSLMMDPRYVQDLNFKASADQRIAASEQAELDARL